MAKKAVVDAVIGRLKDNWEFSTIIDTRLATGAAILDRNVSTQTPADGSPWVRVEFPVANDRPATLKTSNREDGGFRIIVATAIGDGMETSNDWCEQIAALFNRQKFDGVQCWAPTIREGVDDGSYYIATVVVPYYFPYSN